MFNKIDLVNSLLLEKFERVLASGATDVAVLTKYVVYLRDTHLVSRTHFLIIKVQHKVRVDKQNHCPIVNVFTRACAARHSLRESFESRLVATMVWYSKPGLLKLWVATSNGVA